MATIRIHRPFQFSSFLRTYSIYVDGNYAGHISPFNWSLTVHVSPGRHVILAWDFIFHSSRPLDIDVSEFEIRDIEVGAIFWRTLFIPFPLNQLYLRPDCLDVIPA